MTSAVSSAYSTAPYWPQEETVDQDSELPNHWILVSSCQADKMCAVLLE